MARSLSIICLLTVLLSVPISAVAKPGALDRAFGRGGAVVTQIGADATATHVAAGPAGTVLAAGTAEMFASDGRFGPYALDLAVARYTASGRLDRRFGTDGVVTVDLGANETLGALAVQADGRIVLAGETKQKATGDARLAVARLMPDGRLDPTFGAGSGYVVAAPTGFMVTGTAIRLGGDGTITVGGSYLGQVRDPLAPPNAALLFARWLSDGKPDPTFGGDGDWLRTFEGGGGDVIGIDPARGFVVRGGTTYAPVLGRFTFEGDPDSSYGVGGAWTPPLAVVEATTAFAIQRDGGVLIATADTDYSVGHRSRPRLMRVTPGGALDPSFVIADLPYTPNGRSLLALPDGRVLVGSDPGRVRRYLANGRLDPTWRGATARRPIHSMKLWRVGGRIVAAGQDWKRIDDDLRTRFGLARFLTR